MNSERIDEIRRFLFDDSDWSDGLGDGIWDGFHILQNEGVDFSLLTESERPMAWLLYRVAVKHQVEKHLDELEAGWPFEFDRADGELTEVKNAA